MMRGMLSATHCCNIGRSMSATASSRVRGGPLAPYGCTVTGNVEGDGAAGSEAGVYAGSTTGVSGMIGDCGSDERGAEAAAAEAASPNASASSALWAAALLATSAPLAKRDCDENPGASGGLPVIGPSKDRGSTGALDCGRAGSGCTAGFSGAAGLTEAPKGDEDP